MSSSGFGVHGRAHDRLHHASVPPAIWRRSCNASGPCRIAVGPGHRDLIGVKGGAEVNPRGTFNVQAGTVLPVQMEDFSPNSINLSLSPFARANYRKESRHCCQRSSW